jgi:hypothetical protein
MTRIQSTARSISALLNRLANLLDRSPLVCVFILLAATAPYIFVKAASNHLTCDEVYTLRIAQKPTLHEMISVSRRIDLHPPLHYLAERASLATHLPFWIAARFSSLLATLGTVTLLFLFTYRRSGALFGLFSATVFWFTPAMDFAWSNRPYALWLFLLILSTFFWQRSNRSALHAIPLFLSVGLMVSDYMFGLACILPLMLAEGTRTIRQRRIHWPTWIALIVPSIAGAYYMHQVSDFANNSFARAFLDWSGQATTMYIELVAIPLVVAIGCSLVATLLYLESRNHTTADIPVILDTTPDSAAVTTLAISLFLLPALLAFLSGLRHTQFFPRYGACAAVGLALLLTSALQRYASAPRATVVLATLAIIIGSLVKTNDAPFLVMGPWRAEVLTGVPPLNFDNLNPNIPLVIASPTGFTEMNANEPTSLLDRTWNLTDRPDAIKYSGSTVFENEATAIQFLGLQGHSGPYADFLAAHPQFYMVADYNEPEEWLPRALLVDGAHSQYLGKLAVAYHDNDLYLVTH